MPKFGKELANMLREVGGTPVDERVQYLNDKMEELGSREFTFARRESTAEGVGRITVFSGAPIDIVVTEKGTVLQQISPNMIKKLHPEKHLSNAKVFSVWAAGGDESLFRSHPRNLYRIQTQV